MIPYGRQSVDEDDIDAVSQVLRSDWLTQGPVVEAFEAEFSERVGAQHGVAFSNGTAALHAACWAAGIQQGDRVVTSPLTFVASANRAAYVGADVDLVDVDPESLNLDVRALEPNTDGLVAVHFAGLPIDLSALAHRPRVIIEDAAHALGASTPLGPVGNCALSDACVFSFHPVKHITTGEGGMVTTNEPDLAAALRRFRSHGVVPTPERGGWSYDVLYEGYNFRLTDIQAALGRSQPKKLGTFVDGRRRLAQRYRELLADLPVRLPPGESVGFRHAYHLFTIRVPARAEVYQYLRTHGVGVQVHYVPVHQHTRFRHLDVGSTRFPNADKAYAELLSLPLYPGLTEDQQVRVVSVLAHALQTFPSGS